MGMAMTYEPDLGALIDITKDATVSRTALRAEGVRIVLFSFDTGQELTEHSAAMPVLIHLIDGAITVIDVNTVEVNFNIAVSGIAIVAG